MFSRDLLFAKWFVLVIFAPGTTQGATTIFNPIEAAHALRDFYIENEWRKL